MNTPKRIAVFASYSYDNKIHDYVVYYLKELKKVCDTIVFVSDCDIPLEEQKKLEGYADHAMCTRHGCYDFGSYKRGYFWLMKNHILENADELVFCNDSCFGPIFPFTKIFGEMENRDCDFWGLVDSQEKIHHILSFFFTFKRQVFLSPEFCNFVSSFKKLENFWEYVNRYERPFTSILEEAGFRSDTYIKLDEAKRLYYAYLMGNGNTTSSPIMLFDEGMPLIKIKGMNGAFGNDLHESPSLLMEKIKEVNPELHDIIKNESERYYKPEDKWLTPREIIGDAEVVSFDVFDTLLERPFTKPTDLFLQIENDCDIESFCSERIKAEKKARKRHSSQADVTFDQIYDEIPERFKKLKETELQYEYDLLYAKEDGKKIYEEAVKQGKTVIVISDMYLPKDFITKALVKNGYTEIKEVFVSNEENCCKYDSKLFTAVLKKLNLSPDKVVHIGDNIISDKQSAEKVGIRGCHRPMGATKIYDNPAFTKFKLFSQQKGLAASRYTGILSYHFGQPKIADPYREVGYVLGGLLAVGYAQHIHKVARERGIDGILFVSRDGYTVKEVYERLYPNDDIKCYYIQASRKLILRNSYDYTSSDQLRNVYQMFSNECLGGITIEPSEYSRYKEQIAQWTANNKRLYDKYVVSLGITGNKLMTVDMTTYNYTSLDLLSGVFGDRIDCGMFSVTYGISTKLNALSYANFNWKAGDEPRLMLQEELITAPQFSVYGLNEDLSFYQADYNPTERIRIENYKKILEGILAFTDDYKKLSASHPVEIAFEDWWKLAHFYFDYSNYGDLEFLRRLYHDDPIQEETGNILSAIIRFKQASNASKENIADPNITNLLYVELANISKKNDKHLKAIRKLLVVLGIETVALIVIIIAMLLK